MIYSVFLVLCVHLFGFSPPLTLASVAEVGMSQKIQEGAKVRLRTPTATATFGESLSKNLQGAGGGSVSSSDGDNEKSGCFAGTETLLLDSGVSVAMDEVKIGDRVQVSSSNGILDYSEVIFLPHMKNNEVSPFLEIETSSGSSLKVTPNHLIMAGSCGANDMKLTRADNVVVGDCMDSTSDEIVVTGSSRFQGKGIYTVVTAHPDGMIVVNGFKTSSFAVNHFIGNNYYHIHRLLYAYSAFTFGHILRGCTVSLEYASNQFLSVAA